MRATAASTGTDGWHTAITCTSPREKVQHRDHVVDVVVEIERAVRQRHHAGVDPFGDVDVVVGQEALDRAAQQRRVVARHRRDDQQPRLRPARRMLERALEMQEPAERPLPDRS